MPITTASEIIKWLETLPADTPVSADSDVIDGGFMLVTEDDAFELGNLASDEVSHD